MDEAQFGVPYERNSFFFYKALGQIRVMEIYQSFISQKASEMALRVQIFNNKKVPPLESESRILLIERNDKTSP